MHKLIECTYLSCKCHYKCCDHIDSSYYLFMYPGEFESSTLYKGHIQIIGEKYGAMLGKCKCTVNEREKCDGREWFKPLDCWSYPFFPSIINGKLTLKVDSIRCPLSASFDLHEHHNQIFEKWNNLIKNKDIYRCIEKINIRNYTDYILSSNEEIK